MTQAQYPSGKDIQIQHQRFLSYLRECYESDNREQTVWNVCSKQCELLKAVDLNTAIDGQYRLLVSESYFAAVEQLQQTHFKEKRFLVGSTFLLLKGLDASVSALLNVKSRSLCAPVFIFEAEPRSENGEHWLDLDLASLQINGELLAFLGAKQEPRVNGDLAQNSFACQLNEELIRFVKNHVDPSLQIVLAENFPTETCPTQPGPPETVPSDAASDKREKVVAPDPDQNLAKSLKQRIKCLNKNSLEVLPLSLSFFANNSLASRGILYELGEMAGDKGLSSPIKALLGASGSQFTDPVQLSIPARLEMIPGVLSKAQRVAVENAATKTLSMVVGPPGTGKSHTISCMALDRFLAGESVLIVSKNELAVDVVFHKLVQDFSIDANAIVRGGSKEYLKRLKAYFAKLTERQALSQLTQDKRGGAEISKRSLNLILRKTRRAEYAFLSMCQKLSGIPLLHELRHLSFWWRLRNYISIRSPFKKGFILNDLLAHVYSAHGERESLLVSYITEVYKKRLSKVLRLNRETLVTFTRSIRARASGRQEAMQKQTDYRVLLKALPVWLASLSSLQRILPLNKALFDLVIIDEASQCDLATAMPALQRARRAVIVGDTQQLRHVSFLSGAKEEHLQDKWNLPETLRLSFRESSILDLINIRLASQNAVVFLDEHYRSHPHIIEFSNQKFYDSQLRLMTQSPLIKAGVVEIISCDGERENGVNEKEAQAVLKQLKQHIKLQLQLPTAQRMTIGVLSFFREQVDYLNDLVFAKIDIALISRFQIQVGTPYFYQGNEKDVMLISCGVDDTSSANVYRYLDKHDVFNVAMTRARQKQCLFLSANPESMPKQCLLKEYIQYAQAFSPQRWLNSGGIDRFSQEVRDVLEEHHLEVMSGFEIAGIEVDMVASYEGRYALIDLVGFPRHKDPHTLEHYRVLERAGHKLFPIGFCDWLDNRPVVMNQLLNVFQRNTPSCWARQCDGAEQGSASSLDELFKHTETDLLLFDDERALRQLERCRICYAELQRVLKERLSETELTYIRYMESSEELLRSVVDNFESMCSTRRTLSALEDDENSSKAEARFKQFIQHQQGLYQQNDEALAALKKLIEKWMGLSRREAHATLSMDESLSELKTLIRKIELYDL